MYLSSLSVCRHCDLFNASDSLDAADKISASESHKRLPARDLDPAYAEPGSDSAYAFYLFICQYLRHRYLLAAFWHAINTPQIASVGDRYAHIVYFPAVIVFHFLENEVSALSACLLYQVDITHYHSSVYALAHIVYGEQRN